MLSIGAHCCHASLHRCASITVVVAAARGCRDNCPLSIDHVDHNRVNTAVQCVYACMRIFTAAGSIVHAALLQLHTLSTPRSTAE
jgi:hypothetical protein